MDDAKELIYHGMQPEEYVMPKVKYEDIPKDRREKWSSHLATFDGVVSNDQKFEHMLHDNLDYHRAEYRHITEFKKWRVENRPGVKNSNKFVIC